MAPGQHAFSALASGALERRSALRIVAPFPAIVRGTDTAGHAFEEHAHLDNLSGAGIHLHLHHHLELGAMVFAVVRLTMDAERIECGAGVAIRGIVLRDSTNDNGMWGYAVLFVQHRFLFVC